MPTRSPIPQSTSREKQLGQKGSIFGKRRTLDIHIWLLKICEISISVSVSISLKTSPCSLPPCLPLFLMVYSVGVHRMYCVIDDEPLAGWPVIHMAIHVHGRHGRPISSGWGLPDKTLTTNCAQLLLRTPCRMYLCPDLPDCQTVRLLTSTMMPWSLHE